MLMQVLPNVNTDRNTREVDINYHISITNISGVLKTSEHKFQTRGPPGCSTRPAAVNYVHSINYTNFGRLVYHLP
jgi:hypothetical protein